MQRGYLGLSTRKDEGYTYVIVFCSALWAGLYYGFLMFLNMITAQWKKSLGLPFSTASIHQTINAPARYLTTVVTSMYMERMSITWIAFCSIFTMSLSFMLIYLSNFVMAQDNFVILQILVGAMYGIGGGLASPCFTIISQQWLDKKRGQLNPYLMIGAPIVAFFGAPFFNMLCDIYTWPGACLICAGIVCNGGVIVVLYCRHPEYTSSQNNKIYIYDPRLKKHPLVKYLLLFSIISDSLLIIPVFTLLTNVVTEFGMTEYQVATMWMIGTFTELVGRPVFGLLTKKFSITILYVFWSIIAFISMLLLSVVRSHYLIIGTVALNGLFLAGLGGLRAVFIIDMLGAELLRPYFVIEQLVIMPTSLIIPQLSLMLANYFKNPSITYYPSVFGASINLCLAIWFQLYGQKMKYKEEESVTMKPCAK